MKQKLKAFFNYILSFFKPVRLGKKAIEQDIPVTLSVAAQEKLKRQAMGKKK